jgi:DNA-directed RNA polymerase subunit RPC12/RpoP
MAKDLPEEINWKEVATTDGIMLAELMASRLREADIPAYAWQQGAGVALGLMVGPLGEGHVMVPEEMLSEAQDFLAATPIDAAGPDPDDDDFDDDFDDVDEDYDEDDYDDYEEYDEDDEYVSRCPHCGTVVDLDEDEVERGWYECPRCGRRVRL